MTKPARPAAGGTDVPSPETRSRPLLVAALGSFALVLLATLAASSVALIRDLDAYHDQRALIPAAARPDALLGTTIGEPAATAFRRARAILRPGDRFAVVASPSLDRSTAGTYRLFAQHYLFPAVAVASTRAARVVVVLGPRAGAPPSGFEPVLDNGNAWVGLRR